MASDSGRVVLLLGEVLELSTRQLEHFANNRLAQMLECQQERTLLFNELDGISLQRYVKEPQVKALMEKILQQDKDLSLNIESTVGEHKKTISTLQKGSVAIKAYSR